MRLTSLIPFTLISSAISVFCADSWPYGPFATSGRWIHNSLGQNVTYAGVNWPGAADTMIPEGLQYQSIATIISGIKSLGLNVIRLTFAIEMIDDIYNGGDKTLLYTFQNALGTANGLAIYNSVIKNNPSFGASTTRVQVFDAIAAECKKQGIYVHLDNHISKAEWCCSLTDGNGWFGDTYFNVTNWKRGLSYMVSRGANWGNLMSIGLRNEPRNTTDNAAISLTYNWETWYTNMVSAATAVHAANPDVLIFFSGMNYDTTLAPIPLGTNLGSGTVFNKSSFPFASKIVLEIHNYQTTATACSSITSTLYNGGYNAMDTTNTAVKNVLPVILTEWGHDESDTEYSGVYATCLASYLEGLKGGWMLWVLSGSYYIRDGTQDYDETWVVRLLLNIAIENAQIFGAMVEGIERVTIFVTWCDVLERLYLKPGFNVDTGFEPALIGLYTTILKFQCNTIRLYSRNAAKRLLSSLVPTPEKNVEENFKEIADAQANADACVKLIDAQYQQATRNKIAGLEAALRHLEAPIIRSATILSDYEDSLQVREREKILQWLTSVPFLKHHKLKRNEWLEGSCKFCFGKSVKMSSVIEQLRQEQLNQPNAAPIAYFYCSRNPAEYERSSPEEVMRSLLEQIFSDTTKLPIREPVVRVYKEKKDEEKGKRPQPLDLEEITRILVEIFKDNPATIVIDTLDECDPDQRHNLLSALDIIITESASLIRVFVSTRNDGDIVCQLENSSNIFIRASDNSADIEKYVTGQVFEAIKKKRMARGKVSKELEQQIIDTLIGKAQGMFRWVSLQVQQLCDPRRIKHEGDIKLELGHLPKTLRESYDLIYHGILEMTGKTLTSRADCLSANMVRKRKVGIRTSRALEELVGKGDEGACSKAFKISGSLSPMKRTSYRKGTLHPMTIAAEYGYEDIIDTILGLQDEHIYAKGQMRSLLGEEALLRAVESRHKKTVKLLLEYGVDPDCESQRQEFVEDEILVTPLTTSSENGDEEMVQLLSYEADPNVPKYVLRSGKYSTLYLVCQQHHFGITRLLLDAGAEFSTKKLPSNTNPTINPLHFATEFGDQNLVEMLLDRGADIHATCYERVMWKEKFRGIFHFGIRSGSIAMVKLLVRKGADINAMKSQGDTVLWQALVTGNADIVSVLIDLGANVKERDRNCQTMIHWAARCGSKTVIPLLIQEGLDISALDSGHNTPLHFATDEGEYLNHHHDIPSLKEKGLAIIKVLLEQGALIEARDNLGQTALFSATLHSYTSSAEVLLDHGANIEATDSEGNTAIDALAERCRQQQPWEEKDV
ncbi:hypothetical protein G7Y89_g8726 [Cudoniella acicularis]|uniref:Glycoside hydrolase family 5 domain-containing protein n=1 Tax=Cudoniella acicularis TaxID=354080 RepID=A0A8H4RG14_9HELO|nr:hypothetical protein G7Y89_g8726 [Cudoniella acicularis]